MAVQLSAVGEVLHAGEHAFAACCSDTLGGLAAHALDQAQAQAYGGGLLLLGWGWLRWIPDQVRDDGVWGLSRDDGVWGLIGYPIVFVIPEFAEQISGTQRETSPVNTGSRTKAVRFPG